MPTTAEARAALQLVTAEAVHATVTLFRKVGGSAEARRLALLDGVPALVGYFSDGSAALAADFYDDERDRAGVSTGFAALPVVEDRTVKLRRAIAWSAEPLFTGEDVNPEARLAEVVQFEVARPFRDTVTKNTTRDPDSVGWRRVTAGGCAFCRMLADKGAIFRASTARFAAHPHCHCGAQPVFRANDTGETASVLQYVASRHNRTPAQKAELREYLAYYGDS